MKLFILSANDSVLDVEVTYSSEDYKGNITHLKPWTQYQVFMVACTNIGCTRSFGSLQFTTLQDSPHDIQIPTADVGMDFMTLKWNEPLHPNGLITNYTLFHNSTVVYTGHSLHYTVPNLPVFEQQYFKVGACTKVGCNSSEEAILYSAQLPPDFVDPPMLKVLGPHTIEVRWFQPAKLNGILERYVIHLSSDEDKVGYEAYNSTEMFLECTLKNLTAGNRYFILLSACTGGGCKNSSSTFADTYESIPEEIPAPNVVSNSPFSLDVTWKEPIKPNGKITAYSLFMNNDFYENFTAPSSQHIDMLVPYSKHNFRVRVCTLKGCSFSPLTVNRTLESAPKGDIHLTVTAMSSHAISAIWNAPTDENGKMLYSVFCTGLYMVIEPNNQYRTVYEKQILHAGESANEWIYIEGLLPYSEYNVQVNGSNTIGYILSNIRTISMPPGRPVGLSPPVLSSHSYDRIVCTWKDPLRNNAPGHSLFQLQYRHASPPFTEVSVFDEETRQMSYTLEGLQPYTQYEFLLTAFNAHGSISSNWTSIYTKEFKPE